MRYRGKLPEADRNHLLLNEAVPILLYEVPCKQITSKALTCSADDQRQLLCLNTSIQTILQNPRRKKVLK